MTRVAAGCPTTFCDRTAVRSATGSVCCFLERFGVALGLSAPFSALIGGAEGVRDLVRRRSSGGLGSFILRPLTQLFQQFNSRRERTQKKFVVNHERAPLLCL